MTFKTEIKVRGYHIDVFGHVNNARYLEIMEEARWRYIDETSFGEVLNKNNWGFAVVNINIDYKRPAYANYNLVIEIIAKKIGNSSMTVEQIITHKKTGELIASAEVTFVILDLKTNRPARITDEVKKSFLTRETN